MRRVWPFHFQVAKLSGIARSTTGNREYFCNTDMLRTQPELQAEAAGPGCRARTHRWSVRAEHGRLEGPAITNSRKLQSHLRTSPSRAHCCSCRWLWHGLLQFSAQCAGLPALAQQEPLAGDLTKVKSDWTGTEPRNYERNRIFEGFQIIQCFSQTIHLKVSCGEVSCITCPRMAGWHFLPRPLVFCF